MTQETKALQEKRGKLIEQMKALGETIKKEGRGFTEDEDTEFNKIEAEESRLKRSIDAMEREFKLDAHLEEVVEEEADKEKKSVEEHVATKRKHDKLFERFLVVGFNSLTTEEKNFYADVQARAQSVGTGSEGGFLVPEGFGDKIIEATKFLSEMRDIAFQFTTATGNNIPFPTDDDTGNIGEWIGENTAAAEQDVVLGQVTLGAHGASSKQIPVSNWLLQDSAFDFGTYLVKKIARRKAALEIAAFTNGNGTDKPTGFLPSTTLGKTTAAVAAFDRGEMLDLMGSIDPSYQNNARWTFNYATLTFLKKLTLGSGDDTPLWVPSMRDSEPDRIEGKQYTVNQEMPSLGTGNKFMAYGDFQNYYIRDVTGMELKRLIDGKYGEKNQTAFVMFWRTEGKLLDAGQNPIKHMINA